MLLQNNITHFKPKYANKSKAKEIIVTIIEILNDFFTLQFIQLLIIIIILIKSYSK